MESYEQLKRDFCIASVADIIIATAAEYPAADFDEACDRAKGMNEAPDGFTFRWYDAPDCGVNNYVEVAGVQLNESDWAKAVTLAKGKIAQENQY